MTDFEIIMIVLSIVGLLISAENLIIALLDFLDRKPKHK